jgi:hypothetical protein
LESTRDKTEKYVLVCSAAATHRKEQQNLVEEAVLSNHGHKDTHISQTHVMKKTRK